MKTSTLFVVGSALALFSLGAAAVPPGGGPMGGGMPGGMPGRAPEATPGHGAQSGGRSVSEQLTDNTKLSSEIKELTGTDAQRACAGFRNLGSCVAAAHVSKNLGIPFDSLRSKVTGSGSLSLGEAIHELKPDADAKSAARAATRQANADLKRRG
jgi:hypothetical protein